MKKLEHTGKVDTDLLFWIKEYLSIKAFEFFEKSTSNTVDDIIASIELIRNSNSIDEAKENTALLAKDGLKSISRANTALHKFYVYCVNKINSIKDIDTNFLQDFKEWLTISDSTKKGYVDAVLEMISYTQKTNTDKYQFDIDESIVRLNKKSIPRKMIDVMDDEEFERFSRSIIKFKYRNEYEKARDILICRLFIFSGITTEELLKLQVGKSFIVNGSDMLLRMGNRKDIELPRSMLITHFNKYKELSLKNKKYDIEHKPLINISKRQVQNIVKELLEFANIKREPMSPQMIRYSLFVWLYNKRNAENEISFNTIQELSGIKSKKELEKILNTFDKETVAIAKMFKKEKFT